MPRLRLFDLRLSRLPRDLGICASDLPQIADKVNTAQQRLLMCKEASDEGFWGSWAWMMFNIPQGQNILVCPREVARLENVHICGRNAPVQNQFYEFLEFGNRRMAPQWLSAFRSRRWAGPQVLTQNTVPSTLPITGGPVLIQVYATNAADTGPNPPRVLLQGEDQNGNTIYSQDGLSRVTGQFVSLAAPFATAALQMSTLTGIQKDITAGPVQIFQTNPTTGAQVLLATLEPSEVSTSYRAYFIQGMPCCCGPFSNPCLTPSPAPTPGVQVAAIAKLELIPVMTDTDYTLIQSAEAIIEECQSVRYGEMDNETAAGLSALHHKNAVGLLNGQLAHYLGKNTAAVNFAPFGSAKLERVNLGMI